MSFTDSIFKFTTLLRRSVTPPSPADGTLQEMLCDGAGRLLVNADATGTLWQDAGAAAASRTVKGSAGKLYQMFGYNSGGSDVWLFIFNAIAVPGNGSTAELFTPIKIAAGTHFALDLIRPRDFITGLTWAASSTAGTFTAAGSSTLLVSAEYT